MSRVLVTGGTGLFAPYLATLTRFGPVTLTSRQGKDVPCDLTDSDATTRLIETVQPEIVIHCAAMTDVDGCERDPQAAYKINSEAVANLVRVLPNSSRLLMFSTDQVYPDELGPHAEGSEAPVNHYGKSKLAGEAAALVHPNALVLRVNFFGPSHTPSRSSLSDWIITSLRERRPITLFSDSLFSPLHMATLATIAVEALMADLRGIFNVGCRNGASKATFGLQLAHALGLQTDTVTVGRAAALKDRAPRPSDMRMSVTKIENALDRAMPALKDEIAKLQ